MMESSFPLMGLLKKLQSYGAIRALDYQFSQFIFRQGQQEGDAWLAAVLSYELGCGRTCVPLLDGRGAVLTAHLLSFLSSVNGSEIQVSLLSSIDWVQLISRSELIGSPGDKTPMIFDGKRLYLYRYWFYEVALAKYLVRFSQAKLPAKKKINQIKSRLDRLFSRDYDQILHEAKALLQEDLKIRRLVSEKLEIIHSDLVDWDKVVATVKTANTSRDLILLDELVPLSMTLNWQKVAASVVMSRSLTIISGGPGTGKTTTIAKILAVLVEVEMSTGYLPVVKLAAPTGKASARLTESISSVISTLTIDPNIKAQIPTQAITLHRLLGATPDGANFYYGENNPLPLDILIVDEASMVNSFVMYKLFSALAASAKIIFLGDKDQLASVDAGAILGDLCALQRDGYSEYQSSIIERLTGFKADAFTGNLSSPPIADNICVLNKNYRFRTHSGISELATAVNQGSTQDVQKVFAAGYDDIKMIPLSASNIDSIVKSLVHQYEKYFDVLADSSINDDLARARRALQIFSSFRVLCAVRIGSLGVIAINQRIEQMLQRSRKICSEEGWYEGRPVIVNKNDYSLGIYNGDIGLCMKDVVGHIKVYFELRHGRFEGIPPSQLPDHETAYAMTVHKSQGSEFDEILLVLPADYSPIVTRELIYTGITRARSSLTLITSMVALERGIKIVARQAGGLLDLLKEANYK